MAGRTGTGWFAPLPLATETIEAKGFDLILREHDYLRDMLNYKGRIHLALYFGTPMVYGEYHQFGWGVPERQWLGASESDSKQVLDVVAAYLMRNNNFTERIRLDLEGSGAADVPVCYC